MKKLIGIKKTKTAVLISGKGSNLKNLIKFSKKKKSPISIDLIISNTHNAKGLKYSRKYNIQKKVISFKNNKLAEKKIFNFLLVNNIKFIEIGEIFFLENFIRFFKLLPLPEIKTAVLVFLRPINFFIQFNFIFT